MIMALALRIPALLAAALLAAAGCGKPEKKATSTPAKADGGPEKNARSDRGEKRKDRAGDASGPGDPGKGETTKEAAGPSWDDFRDERNKPPADLTGAPEDAHLEKSGLRWKRIKAGTGKVKPGGDDLVRIWYTHWRPDGKRMGTTFKLRRSQPRQFTWRRMVPGWKEALGDMVQGERRVLWLSPRLAYLSRSQRRKGPRIVDLELVEVKVAPAPPPDVSKPPKDAVKTGSGLVYKVLVPGKGDKKPGPASAVVARYAGWKKSGTCFDFTAPGETRDFNLASVIKGWTEGVQLMVAGQKNRFWIPGRLAYDGMAGKPQGQLTFDVELVAVDPKTK